MNRPTKGDHESHQAQKKAVQPCMKSKSSRPTQLLSGPIDARYWPRLVTVSVTMARVGPTVSTNASSSKASSRLTSLRRLIPFSIPLTTDASAIAVMPAISSTWVVSVGGAPHMRASPAVNCSAPRPSEVANPKSVAKTARMSMPWPNRPHTASPMSG